MKFYKYTIFLFVISLSLFSCKFKKKSAFSDRTSIEMKRISLEKVDASDSAKLHLSIKMDLDYPVFSDYEKNHDKSDKITRVFIREVFGLEDEKEKISELFKQILENKYIETRDEILTTSSQETDSLESINLLITDTIVNNSCKVFSCYIAWKEKINGDLYHFHYKGISLKETDLTVLTEMDIFKDPYDDFMNNLFFEMLCEQNGVKTVDELEELGYFDIRQMYPNGNMTISNKGITYFFNPGEYSAPNLGPLKFFIPYEKLKEILKSNSPIANLINNDN